MKAAPFVGKPLVLALVFGASLLFGSLLHFGVERLTSRGRVLPGTSALGVSLAGLSGQGLTDRVRGLSPRVLTFTGRVRVRDRTFVVSASDVGLALDVDGTAARALEFGREGSWLRQLWAFFARPFSHRGVRVAVRFDAAKTEAVLDGFERACLGVPGVEGSVGYTDRVVPTYGREGLALVRPEARRLLDRALVDGGGEAVPLLVESMKPKLSRTEVDRARDEAERLVGAEVVFRAETGEAKLVFGTSDLGRALRSRLSMSQGPHLEVFLDDAALRETIQRFRSELEKPARDATFDVSPLRQVTLVPSELGTRLDDDAILRSVVERTRGTDRQGPLPFQTDVVPALTTEQAQALHIDGLVAEYTTRFPCCEARVKNIERMAALVDKTVVRPGESWSLNARSGPRTSANGFVGGPTIVEGEMEMTIGGGVSQFATTLFNAVFDGGYEIVQRQPHTYWFPRYPEGYDATLGYPLPDLVFRNDSEAGVFIRASTGKTSVRVEIYGNKGGRKVERHVSSRFDVVRPEIELIPNPDLAPDQTRVRFSGAIGWSVNVTRTVIFPDLQKKEEGRKVTYSPRARRVETHPCRIPEGDPGYTGEKCPKVEGPDGGTGE
jgi:vancomycin resistance protein YoaR